MPLVSLSKWTPAVPIKKPDNLVIKAAPGFKPTYEDDKKENMNFIMSMEYRRMWFKERAVFEKNFYTKQQIIKDENKIYRKFVQRMMTFKKPTKNQFIEEDIMKRVSKKTSRPDEVKNYDHYKYKFKCGTKPSHKQKNEN